MLLNLIIGLICLYSLFFFFFFNDTATTEIYTLSLHDVLPICEQGVGTKGDVVKMMASMPCDVKSFTLSDWKLSMVKDRKSTRLNSSHTVISYAVFCLKKKKKHRTNKQIEIKYKKNETRRSSSK